MVNWSPSLGTAVSDLEVPSPQPSHTPARMMTRGMMMTWQVDYTEEAGKLYYFKYMLADGAPAEGEPDHLAVATTRPETILGDAAVCVHPEDERYKHLVGKEVRRLPRPPVTSHDLP